MAENMYMNKITNSLAHTCGNITSITFNHVKDKFPPKFFKSSHISTRIALREFAKIKDSLLEMKKKKPIIAVQPKLIMDQTEFNIDNFHRLYGVDLFDATRPGMHTQKFFNDPDNAVYIEYAIDRIKMAFEFTYVVGTEFQQYNIAGYMRDRFRIDHPYYQPAIIETEIPDIIIRQISEHSSIPIFDASGSVTAFLSHLNSKSSHAITYKMKTSTQQYHFFILTQVNLLMTFEGMPNLDDGEVNGQITEDFTIRNTVNVEFNYIKTFYYLSFDKPKIIENNNDDYNAEVLSVSRIFPMFTIQNPDVFAEDENGYQLYTSTAFDLEDEHADVTLIKTLFNQDMVDLIADTRSKGIDPSVLLNIKLYKDSELIEPISTNYDINWDTLELTTYNGDIYSTYRVSIYQNSEYINGLFADKYEQNKKSVE